METAVLARALGEVAARAGARGFGFDDLARAGRRHDARIGDVAEWLARARSAGLLEDLGFDRGPQAGVIGPRRYRVAGTGTGSLPGGRRDRDAAAG